MGAGMQVSGKVACNTSGSIMYELCSILHIAHISDSTAAGSPMVALK